MPVDSTLRDPLNAAEGNYKALVLDPWIADVAGTIATLEAGGGGPLIISRMIASQNGVRPANSAAANGSALATIAGDLESTSADRSELIFDEEGDYLTDATMTMSNLTKGVLIRGQGEWRSRLLHTVNSSVGAPVLRIYADTGNCDGVHIENICIGYQNMQTTAHHQSYGIMIDAPESGTKNVVGWHLDNVKLHRCYIGAGIRQLDSDGTARNITVGWWNSHIGRIDIGPVAQSGLVIQSPNPIGMPEWTMDNVYIANTYEAMWTTTGPGGPALALSGVNAVIGHLGVEGWYNRVVNITGGGQTRIGSLYTEWHRFTGVAAESSGSSYPAGLYVDGTSSVPGVLDVGILQWNLGGATGTAAQDVSQEQGSGGDVIDFSTILNAGEYATVLVRYLQVKFVSARAQGNSIIFDGTTTGAPIFIDRFVDAEAGVANQQVTMPFSTVAGNRIRRWDGRDAIITKAGAIADSDFQVPVDGLMGLDETNHRLYVRDGGVWKYAALT